VLYNIILSQETFDEKIQTAFTYGSYQYKNFINFTSKQFCAIRNPS